MSDIFISYTRADQAKARLLADRFAAEGWAVWWDAALVPGDQWNEVVESELGAARCVVVLWSKASVAPDKRWVRNEARDGLDRGILVPAMLEAVTLPVEFRGVQAADLSGWGGQRSHVGLQQLLTAVAVKLGAPVRGNRPALDGVAPPCRGQQLDDARLRRSVVELSLHGRPVGTGFALAGTELVVSDSNVQQGLAALARGSLAPGVAGLEARTMAGDPMGSLTLALPAERAQDVMLLQLASGVRAESVIGLDETAVPKAGDAALVVVAVGAKPGVSRGRLTAVGASAAIAGMPGGPAQVDELIECNIVTAAGSAGAPLLRADGALIGVVVAGDGKRSLCVPAARLVQRLLAAGFVAAQRS